MLSGDEDFAGIVGRAHLILRGDVESVIVQAKVGEHRVAWSVFRLNQGSRKKELTFLTKRFTKKILE